jgi:hypothetical protein
MKKKTVGLLAATMAGALSLSAHAAEDHTYSRQGYTLTFDDASKTADQHVVDQMVSTFFTVYPRMAHDFNPNTARHVTFVIDPAYDGVAATDNDRTVFNPQWFIKHPADTDVVTHEVMHIVQAYGHRETPGWLVEGIADYVRYRYGVNNAAAGWKLPDLKPGQKYTDSYRITARFLAWLEAHGHPGIVRQLDAQLRGGTYGDASWQRLAGKPVDALWGDYVAAPAL